MIPIFPEKPDKPKAARPRGRRGQAPPLVLGKTKRTVLLLLARHVFLRADQVTVAAFGRSLPFVRAHLRELVAAGWVLRAPYLRDGDLGKAPYVYTLNTPGWEWVGQLGLPTPVRFRPSEEVGKASPHTMEISAFGVALERFCRANPAVAIAQYRHERVLPYAAVRLPEGTQRRLRPDAWVQLAVARPDGLKQRCFVLEVDRASEYQVALREKIRALLHYRTEAYRAQFGTESIAILFTVPTAHRLGVVRAAVEAEVAAHEGATGARVRPDLFWLTDADPRRAGPGLFTEPLWRHPFAAAPVSLLEAGPAAGGREHALSAGFLGEQGMLRFYRDIGARPPATSLETDIEEVV
jgi:hypothetical protein